MSCPHAKRQWPGHEKPYQVCLHPDVKLCKCFDENVCPLKTGVIPAKPVPPRIEEMELF